MKASYKSGLWILTVMGKDGIEEYVSRVSLSDAVALAKRFGGH